MVNKRELCNLKKRLEGHNATCESTGISKSTVDYLVKTAKKTREEWASNTKQSWMKREKEGKK